MNNDQPPTQSEPAPGVIPVQRCSHGGACKVWLWKPGLVSCAVLCIVAVDRNDRLWSEPSPSSTSQNRVVFDQTVSAMLVTPAFILTGSQQTLAWSCSPGGTASLIIYMGAAGSDPADAQPIFKGLCALSATSGTNTLHTPPGSYFLRFLPGGSWHITLTDIDYSSDRCHRHSAKPQCHGDTHPTPPPFSPSVGYQTAWGTHAATATYSMVLDSTHTFAVDAVAPDGRMLLVGGEWELTVRLPGRVL